MTIPAFNQKGDLPTGVHRASLVEVISRFGTGSEVREQAGKRLQRIFEIASQTKHLARFAVFGSFVTVKQEPNDVEIS